MNNSMTNLIFCFTSFNCCFDSYFWFLLLFSFKNIAFIIIIIASTSGLLLCSTFLMKQHDIIEWFGHYLPFTSRFSSAKATVLLLFSLLWESIGVFSSSSFVFPAWSSLGFFFFFFLLKSNNWKKSFNEITNQNFSSTYSFIIFIVFCHVFNLT